MDPATCGGATLKFDCTRNSLSLPPWPIELPVAHIGPLGAAVEDEARLVVGICED